nr:MAG: hypothetical protein [Molluscum contagiosum virus]
MSLWKRETSRRVSLVPLLTCSGASPARWSAAYLVVLYFFLDCRMRFW